MKRNSRAKEAVYTLFFMLIATVTCVSAVSVVYQLSKSKIKQNQTLLLKKAVLLAGGVKLDKETPDAIDHEFKKQVKEVKTARGAVKYFLIKGKSIIIPQTGVGLWGTIESVIGFYPRKNELTGIYFTANNETPGLGKRIEEEWFRNQFVNKAGPIEMLPPDTPTNKQQFDAITGATITSEAVKTMVNSAFEKAETYRKEDQ